MPRIRSIHPDACKSEKLAASSAEAERLYWRLQTHCDDEGRAEDDPRIFAAYLFPLNESTTGDVVNQWLAELDERGLIIRYQAEGRNVLQVVRWDYQNPKNPSASKLPAIPDDWVRPTPHLPHNGSNGGEALPLGVGVGVGVGASPKVRKNGYEAEFETWWSRYPRKVDKADASGAFAKACKEASVEQLTEGLDRSKAAWDREHRPPDKIPHAATWLNKKRWTDDYEAGAEPDDDSWMIR